MMIKNDQGGADHGRRAVLQRVRQLQLQQLPQLARRPCPAQGEHHHHRLEFCSLMI